MAGKYRYETYVNGEKTELYSDKPQGKNVKNLMGTQIKSGSTGKNTYESDSKSGRPPMSKKWTEK